jgi:transposase-like protein
MFEGSMLGKKYPSAVAVWKSAWDRFTPFLEFPPAVRRVIYTTNAIESLNYQLRKVTKNRSQFPTDDSVVKLLWLAICNIEDKRAAERHKARGQDKKNKSQARLVEGQITTNWMQALAQLATAYPERINHYL